MEAVPMAPSRGAPVAQLAFLALALERPAFLGAR
jgi:hypothetical protein